MIPIRPMLPIYRTRGSALLAVLWMTVILGFVGMALAANGRSEVESTRLLAESEQGYFLARAGIEAALLRIALPPADPKQAEEERNFRQYDFQFETGTAHVEYFPVSALYNVNQASPRMLDALFVELGLTDEAAVTLVGQIQAYRYPNGQKEAARDLRSLDELLALPAMTPELFYGGFAAGRRRPPLNEVLGVYGTSDSVNVNYAHPELMAVLPGMTESWAQQLVAMRPIRQLDPQRMPASLTLNDAPAFSLIAHGRGQVSNQQPSDIERVIRAVYVRGSGQMFGLRLVEWHDTN